MKTINEDVQAFFTEHEEGEYRWGYLLFLNTSDEERPYAMEPPLVGDYLLWNGLSREIVSEVGGTLGPGRLAFYVLVPERDGMGLLGLTDKFVPMPQRLLAQVKWNDGWHIAPKGQAKSLAVLSEKTIVVETADGRGLPIKQQNKLWTIDLADTSGEIHIYRG